jgi:hypothetical protein
MSMTIPEPRIHASAVVEDGAVIGEGCEIGPFCVIGIRGHFGARVVVKSHAVSPAGPRSADTVIFPFATVGEVPQDLKYTGRADAPDRRRALPHPRGGHAEHRHRRRRRDHARGR